MMKPKAKLCALRPTSLPAICLTLAACAVFGLAQVMTPRTARAQFEKPAMVDARTLLEPEILNGKYHSVDPEVNNEGFFYKYRVKSPFGDFAVVSTGALRVLIHELAAIAAMKEVKTDETLMASLKQSGENTVTGLKNLVADPQGTMEGAAQGVGSLFNRVSGTMGKRKTTGAEDSTLEQAIGLSKSKGKVATRYSVSVYSRNPALQKELERLAVADFLGGLGVGVATSFIPGVGGLILSTSGTARLLNEAVNTTPGSELWLQNKNKLMAMNVDEDSVELFLNNPVFSPALQTVMTAALESMDGVNNRELFVKVALQASDPDMARTITETAVMTAGYHRHVAPLSRLAPLARISRAETKEGRIVVLLPTDTIAWTAGVADVTAALTEKAGSRRIELWVLGDVSEMTRSRLTEMGWDLHTKVQSRLIPKT